MENDRNAVIVGVRQNLLVKLHGLLLVAGEEVHLNAFHAVVAQPFHLGLTGDGIVHGQTQPLGGIVPGTV